MSRYRCQDDKIYMKAQALNWLWLVRLKSEHAKQRTLLKEQISAPSKGKSATKVWCM